MNESKTLSLLEQAVLAELGYYRQGEHICATAEDWASWDHFVARHERVRGEGKQAGDYVPPAFAHHILERHGYSLHRYMSQHLSPAAWLCWFEQGGLVNPFRVPNTKTALNPL